MTLREQITADVAGVFLVQDDFAEECSFLPKDGEPRTITCVVDEDTRPDETSNGKFVISTLQVFCSRDEATGIARPKNASNPEGRPLYGDGFKRESTPGGANYSYAGVITDVDENAWTVHFQRRVPFQLGGNR